MEWFDKTTSGGDEHRRVVTAFLYAEYCHTGLLLSSVLESVAFGEKVALYATRIPWRGKPMGSGLPTDCPHKKHGSFVSFWGGFKMMAGDISC